MPSLNTISIMQWYDKNARALPWRHSNASPWSILVSEIMLQQTPVTRVLPYWHEWTHRWPTPDSFAAEPQSEAIKAWGKLGYPRRAMRLHQSAKAITQDHNGVIPAEVATLLTLPGIGAYTARAVSCFAYGNNVPVVDTNVRRVLRRAIDGVDPVSPKASDLSLAQEILPNDDTGPRFSAAVMELGALVCTSLNPKCALCPLRTQCAWRRNGYPAPATAKKVQKYQGTDRQVRGLLLDLLKENGAVPREKMLLVWPDLVQCTRALDSLVTDGLATTDLSNQHYQLAR